MNTKFLALMMVLCLLTALLAGCGSSSSSTSSTESTVAETTQTAEAAEVAEETTEAAEEEAGTVAYPLSGDNLSLSVFTSFPGNLTSYMSTFAEQTAFLAAEEATGVHIEFYEYTMENASTQFELMVASDSLPDVVIGFDDMYQGGVAAAYEGELIYDISGMLETYAPDYLAYVNASELNQSIAYEQDGTMLAVYGFYEYDYSIVSNGILIRQDWLDGLGLDIPVTYDDWYETLTAFRDAYGATAALLLPNGSESNAGTYAGGYGVPGYSTESKNSGLHFYQVDGVVTSGLIEDSYKEYLQMMNQWYEEGLIYSDFYSNDTRDVIDGLVLSDQTGIFDGKVDYITRYESADTTGEMKLVGIANPVMNEGDINGFGNYVTEWNSTSITTNCSNPELALSWLNYFFTDAGILLANYGTEGVSYTLNAEGEPEFTDLILNNEDSELAYGNVTRLYLLDQVVPTLYDQTKELVAYTEVEQSAIALWTANKDNSYKLPTLTLEAAESEEFSAILTDVETYASECIIKFIIGDKPFSEWEDFTDVLKTIGIERCIEIYQDALDALEG